jgi:outer membrane protein OmpA-like peptidoglycan-associated protein
MMHFVYILIFALFAPIHQSVAQDTGVNGHGFQMIAQDGDPRDLLMVQRPGYFAAGEFFTTAMFEFTGESVTQVEAPSDGSAPIYSPRLANVFGVHLGGGVAVHDRVRLDLSLPLFFMSSGRNGQAQGGGLGDMRFSVAAALVRPERGSGFGLSVVPFMDLPTGTTRKFLGQGGFGGGLKLAAGYELAKFTFTADIGIDLNDSQAVANLSNPHQLLAGLGVGFLVTEDIGINAEFAMSQQLSSATDAFSPGGTESPMQAALTVRGKTKPGAHWIAGGSAGLSRGVGAAAFRIFVGAGFGKIKDSASPGLPQTQSGDRDGDGLVGDMDKCPDEAETYNDYRDDDGCADALATLYLQAVHYDKPIEDLPIALTGAGGTIMSKTALQPVEVTDLRPGLYDIRALSPNYEGNLQIRLKGGDNQVKLEIFPTDPGVLSITAVNEQNEAIAGAMVTIAAPGGGDGIQVTLDENGMGQTELAPGGYTVYIQADKYGIFREDIGISSRENKGFRAILVAPRAAVAEKSIDIVEKVFFQLNSADIEQRSHALLNEIAALLQRNADIQRVEIAGHTSSDGTAEHNKTLSVARAKAVVEFLTMLGVAEFRLKAVGYGEAVPLNKENAESSENRRVEFVILKRK